MTVSKYGLARELIEELGRRSRDGSLPPRPAARSIAADPGRGPGRRSRPPLPCLFHGCPYSMGVLV